MGWGQPFSWKGGNLFIIFFLGGFKKNSLGEGGGKHFFRGVVQIYPGRLQKPGKVEKCEKSFFLKCHCSTIIAIRPSTRSLHNLWKRVF